MDRIHWVHHITTFIGQVAGGPRSKDLKSSISWEIWVDAMLSGLKKWHFSVGELLVNWQVPWITISILGLLFYNRNRWFFPRTVYEWGLGDFFGILVPVPSILQHLQCFHQTEIWGLGLLFRAHIGRDVERCRGSVIPILMVGSCSFILSFWSIFGIYGADNTFLWFFVFQEHVRPEIV